MKASELRDRLDTLIAAYGDLEVFADDYDHECADCENVTIIAGYAVLDARACCDRPRRSYFELMGRADRDSC